MASYILAGMHELGSGVPVDTKKTLYLLRVSANLGYVRAMEELGTRMLFGEENLKAEIQEGKEVLAAAILKGSVKPNYILGTYYMTRERNFETALVHLKSASNRGHLMAKYNLMLLFLEGGSVRELALAKELRNGLRRSDFELPSNSKAREFYEAK